jgi:membrane protease subunit HflC
MKSLKLNALLFAGAILVWVLSSALYSVSETEQVLVTQFGKAVGEVVKDAGLHLKTPWVQHVNRFEKRVLEWDGAPVSMPTRDKVYIVVDSFARWRITDARAFFENLRDERGADSRLTDILGSETRNVIARHDFIEAIRSTKERKAAREATSTGTNLADSRIGTLPPILRGRSELEREIFGNAAPKVKQFGIELMDLRFKRINYTPAVSQTIYQRMTSERTQIAERFRSEGAGEAAKILGQRERDLKEIESEAYRKAQEIQGKADAEASAIYAGGYNKSPKAVELFEFLRSMDAYRVVLGADSSLILSTQSDFLRFLKSASGESKTAMPAPSPLGGAAALPSLLDLLQKKP